MAETNIKFSSVPVTESLHKAIRGVAEISGASEEDFIHQTLAFFCLGVLLNLQERLSR